MSWRLGFIALKGRGKSTLLKLLAEAYEYSGPFRSPVDFDYSPYAIPEEIPPGEGPEAYLPYFSGHTAPPERGAAQDAEAPGE